MKIQHVEFANSICHPRMFLSGIHDFKNLKTGFRPRITAGMTNYESINLFSQAIGRLLSGGSREDT